METILDKSLSDNVLVAESEIENASPTVVPAIQKLADPLLALEHYHRYLYASRFVKNKRVLDIACGEGYGSAFLSLNATEVVGVDRDESKVTRARTKYAEFSKAQYVSGLCEEYAAPAASFDVAVSLGTLQHLDIEARHRFLQNVKQAIKQSGVVVLSSPIRYSNTEKEQSLFSALELSDFLKQYFKNIIFVGQKALTVSTIWSLYEWSDDYFRFHLRDDLFALPREDEQFSNPSHLLAICSNEYLSREIADSSKSFYYDVAQAKEAEGFFARSEELELRVTELQAERDSLREQTARHITQSENLRDEIQQHRGQIHELERGLFDRDSTIEMLKKDLAASRASTETLQQAYDLRTSRANSLKEEHAVLTQQVQEMRSKMEEQSFSARQTSEENEQFRKTILDLNDRTKERMVEEAKNQEERQKLTLKVADLERQLSDRTNAIHRSMEEAAGLQARLTHLENLSSEKSRNAVYAVEELQHAQEEAESLHRQMDLNRQSIDELTKERDMLREQSRGLSEDRAHYEALTEQSDTEQRKLADKIALMEKQTYERTIQESKNASEQERMRRQLRDLQASFDEKSASAASLASELERVRAELVVTELDKEERLKVDANLSEKVKDQTDFLVNLQRECDTQATTIRLLKAEMEKQAIAFDTYQKSSSDLQARYNKSQIKAQESEATIAILEQKIEQITKSGTYKVLANIGFIPKDK